MECQSFSAIEPRPISTNELETRPTNCRILYLVGQLMPGGAEQQLCYLLQAIDRERYRPALAVWSLRENDMYVSSVQKLGIPIYSFPQAVSGAAKLTAFRQLVGTLKPEILHSCSFFTNFAAWWAALGRAVIPIGAIRGNFILDKKDSGLLLGSLSARWPRAHIINSFASAENARRTKGLFGPRYIYVVRNGLDLHRFRAAPLPSERQVRIVGIGSLVPVKRWDRLLLAAVQLKRKGCDFSIRIVGDGPLRGSLERQSRELGVTSKVKFLGHSNNVPDLLANSTFLVHTSDSEGYPNVLMEAMACGRAVVATDVGDVASLVEDGHTGFLVGRGEDAMLVERMIKLIRNRDLCWRMGEAGRAKAEREFGLDRMVKETLDAYQKVGWKD
jgi:glycosyltransferase involved in cell wall biosynthesis